MIDDGLGGLGVEAGEAGEDIGGGGIDIDEAGQGGLVGGCDEVGDLLEE
ncbi:MAG: hypothetical protein RI897_3945 [Verrucomicrobiota bacterium]